MADYSPVAVDVSVIVPAFNAERTITACLRSALAQSLTSTEVIVVDDGSTDKTRQVIETLAADDSRVKAIYREQNGGVCNARNAALDAAHGIWAAVLDADDTMHKERLERLLAAASALGADWIADDQYFIREGETTPVARLFVDEPEGARLISASHLVARDRPDYLNYGLLKPLVRRSFLRAHAIRYRTGAEGYEDFLFTLDCAAHGAKFALLNEPLYNYTLRLKSLSSIDWAPRLRRMAELSKVMRATVLKNAPPSLLGALEARERLIERSLRYCAVVTPLKGGKVGAACKALMVDPLITPVLIKRLALRLWQRLWERDPLERVLLSGRVLRPTA